MNSPYEMGHQAGKNGSSVGVNPFNPESQPVEYEEWINGWAEGSKRD